MYNSSFNPFEYDFIKHIVIKEQGVSDKNNLQTFILLDETNFDFSKVNADFSDIRFAEKKDGTNCLHHWVSYIDNIEKRCCIWLEVPEIKKNEDKTIYVFFGYKNAINRSNINNLGFVFKYNFNHTPISSSIFEGDLDKGVDNNGYYISDNVITTKTDPIKGEKDWEVFSQVYIEDTSSSNNFTFEFVGAENDITFKVNDIDSVSHNLRSSSLESIEEQGIGFEEACTNFFKFAYKEDKDVFLYKVYNKKDGTEYEESIERYVEGNTDVFNIKFKGTRVRIQNLIVRKYMVDEIEIDTSSLYPETEDLQDSMSVELDDYSEDFTDTIFYHESNCGGSPSNLSDSASGEYGTYWSSDDSIEEGYVLIDFGRGNSNLVATSYKHLDSDHIFRHAAVELSANNDDCWESDNTSAWACINFGSGYEIVNCLVLEGQEESSMVKEFKFYGGFVDPRLNSEDWKLLYSGKCEKREGDQVFYFRNYNSYKYYKLEIINTYGSGIKLKNWYMYKNPEDEYFKGITINRLSLLPSVYESNNFYFPKKICLIGTKDYKDWVTLLNPTFTYNPLKENIYGYWQHFTFDNKSKYIAYKLLVEDNWSESVEKFVIDSWQLTQSLEERYNNRVLDLEDENILEVLVDKDTTFDGGWIYGLGEDNLLYIYDDYLAKKTPVEKGNQKYVLNYSLIK